MIYSKKYRIKFLCLFFSINLYAQEIWVEDNNSGEPLEGVAVFNQDKSRSTITDKYGKASLEIFSPNDSLNFQILGYENLKFKLFDLVEISMKTLKMIPQNQILQEVFLSVARSKTSANKIAEKVSIVSAKEIEKRSALSGAEILEISPSVRIQRSQGGGGSPVLRGFEANRVLLVVDGVRMNNAIYRSGHLQNAITVDPHNIERVEIVFGSSSVGYGSDALGGVIHYYTKSPEINRENMFSHEFSSSFNTANSSSVNNLTTSLSFKKWGSITSFSYSNFGDILSGDNRIHNYSEWGLTNFYSENNRNNYSASPTFNSTPSLQKNTGYNQYDLFQKFSIRLPKDMLLNLNLQYSSSSDIPRYDKLSEIKNGTLKFSEWYYGPQERIFISPQLKFFLGKSWLKKGTITGAFQKIKESRINRKFDELRRLYFNEKVNVFSLNADFNGSGGSNISYSYGLELTHNSIDSNAFSNDLVINNERISNLINSQSIPSRYPDAGSSYSSYAAYFNFIYELSEKLTFNAGIRITSTLLKANWNDSTRVNKLLSSLNLKKEALTGTIALTYLLKEKWKLSSLISSGFRNPNIDDIGKVRENSGFLLVPNSFLKPEYAYTFDAGIVFSEKNNNYASLRGYATLVSRHIVRSDFSIFGDTTTESLETIIYNGDEVITQANKNLGNRFIYGLSSEFGYQLNKRFNSRFNFTFTKGNKDYSAGPMPSIPPFFGSFYLNYESPKITAQINWKFSASKDPYEYSWGGEDGLDETPIINPLVLDEREKYAGSPKWNTLSLFSQYRFSEKTKLKFGMTNIFDIHYRTFASGISSEGRSFYVGIKTKI
tara:strand:- start:6199 stop:8688 length:2490 start_codon:yes stop_codon:yes gene_type:complete